MGNIILEQLTKLFGRSARRWMYRWTVIQICFALVCILVSTAFLLSSSQNSVESAMAVFVLLFGAAGLIAAVVARLILIPRMSGDTEQWLAQHMNR